MRAWLARKLARAALRIQPGCPEAMQFYADRMVEACIHGQFFIKISAVDPHGVEEHSSIIKVQPDGLGTIEAEPITTLEQLEKVYQQVCRGRHISEIAPALALRNKALESFPLREFFEKTIAIHGIDSCDEQTIERVRAASATLTSP